MNHSAADEIILTSLRTRWDDAAWAQAQALATRSDVDWNALWRQIDSALLAPLLYQILRHLAGVPGWLVAALERRYLQNARRSVLLLHELSRVLTLLESAHIPVLALKGAALASTIYDDIAQRPMRDVDVLLSGADIEAARRVLESHGYAAPHPETWPGITLRFENELLLVRQGLVEHLLELHWSLFDSPFYQEVLTLNWFWETAVPLRIASHPAHMLGPEAQLLHLCAHGVLHHGMLQRDSRHWLWLHDTAALLAAHAARLDWAQIRAQARANHLVLPLRQVVERLRTAWGVPVPRGALANLTPSPAEISVFARLTAARRSVARRMWHDLASMSSWQRRCWYALGNLFPAPTYMRERYGVRHGKLLPLAYARRWRLGLRGVWDHV